MTIRWRDWISWLAVLALATAALVGVRDHVAVVHVALLYLLVVQLASARGGRALGLTMAAAAFLSLNWFFLPPYGTLALENSVDWIVLIAFLATAIVSAELLYRAQALGAERAGRAAVDARAKSLEQSHREKDAMLAAVSHDLRTPLTTIKGLAHEIDDERAEVIEEEADRLNRFVGKLLDISRVTLGTAAMDIQANEAEDLLGAAAQQVQGSLNDRELVIIVEPSSSMLFGRFDFAQSLRVLVNLLENAIKYSSEPSPIELGARRVDNELQFWVADRGPGILEGERERIFAPFYRPPGPSSTPGGAGLGLSIARGIAEAQHGSLTYRPRDGGGSVFTLSVPALDLDSP